MNCVEAGRLVYAYADGELDVAGSLNIEEHLRSCPTCAATVRKCRELGNALRGAGLAYEAPTRLRQRVASQIRTKEVRDSRPGRVWLWQWLALGATVTTAMVLIFQPFSSTSRNRLEDEVTAAHVRSLMASHLTDVASTDRHTVKPWFSGRLDFTVPVEDFAAQGFELTGGRLDFIQNHPAAALIYKHGGHTINVFVWPGKGRGSRQASIRGYSVAEDESGGLQYCAVSDMDGAELQKLLRLLHK